MKKFLFIHIPKAAGSSVNKLFLDALGLENCAIHLESRSEWRNEEERKNLITQKSFLSGHITFSEFEKKTNFDQYFSFAFLRDPYTHLISHLSWIRKLSDPGQETRFNEHPEYIQNLSKKLFSTNLQSTVELEDLVVNLTPQEFSLLDNVQTRYLRNNNNPRPVDEIDAIDAIKNISKISHIGTMENIDSDLSEISMALVSKKIDKAPIENMNPNSYGLNQDVVKKATRLLNLIKHDLVLYDFVKNKKNGVIKFNQVQKNSYSSGDEFQLFNPFTSKVKSSIYFGKKIECKLLSKQMFERFEPWFWNGDIDINQLEKSGAYNIPETKICFFEDLNLMAHGVLFYEDKILSDPSIHLSPAQLKAGGINPNVFELNNKNIILQKNLRISKITGEAIPISRPDEAVYGHWLVDILPRVILAKHEGYECPLISTIHIPNYARDLLSLIGFDDKNIITYKPAVEYVEIEKAIVPSYLRQESGFSNLMSLTSNAFSAYWSDKSEKKIFVSRGDYNSNQTLVNRAELIQLLEKHGFDIIEPHKLDIKEQISKFSEADLVIGEYDSAMHNTIFCKPNTRVIVLQSATPLPFVQAGLGRALNHPTGFLFGTPSPSHDTVNKGRSFIAPLDELKVILEKYT